MTDTKFLNLTLNNEIGTLNDDILTLHDEIDEIKTETEQTRPPLGKNPIIHNH
jgi:hypothetical protein